MDVDNDQQNPAHITSSEITEAHKHCFKNREEIEASSICGCFHCCSVFEPTTIYEWWDDDEAGIGLTAVCPICGIDSVLGSSSNYSINSEFLNAMKKHWF